MKEKDAEQSVEEPPNDTSTPSSRSSSPALTKEPDITAVAAPPANTEDILKIVSHDSGHSDSSDEHSDAKDEKPAKRPKAPSRVISTTSSIYRDAIIVPRSKRRGLLARFAIVAEVEEPHDYAHKTKWLVTFVVAVAGAAAPMGSSIILRKYTKHSFFQSTPHTFP